MDEWKHMLGANLTSFVTGMGMVLDISGACVPARSKQPESELSAIGDDFKKVGEMLHFAVGVEAKAVEEREATQLKLKFSGV